MKPTYAAAALAFMLCLAGCSSDDAAKDPSADAKAPAKKAEASSPSKAAEFFKAIDSKLDKTRVKNSTSDMYRMKNDETVIFHKERRSDSLLEKNDSIDPSYYK